MNHRSESSVHITRKLVRLFRSRRLTRDEYISSVLMTLVGEALPVIEESFFGASLEEMQEFVHHAKTYLTENAFSPFPMAYMLHNKDDADAVGRVQNDMRPQFKQLLSDLETIAGCDSSDTMST